MTNNNTVSQEDLDYLMNTANVEEAYLFNKSLVVAYEFPQLGGWTIRGEGSVIDPANFNIQLGRETAKRDVRNKLWKYMGFLKQLEIASIISWSESWKAK